jgi:hypothetical protein
MAKRIWPGCLFTVLLCCSPVWAQPPAKFKTPPISDILPLLDASSPQALAGVLRGAVLQFMPHPLYEKAPGWGRQSLTANQLKWHRQGIVLKPKIYKTLKNDGTWKKIVLTGNNLNDTLVLDLRDVHSPRPDTLNFDLFLAFDARVEYHQQLWENGVRLYSGTIRARFRVKLLVKCEAAFKLEAAKKTWFPDAVLRLQATGANLSYDNLVFEHVAGIGGSGAKVLGKAFQNILTQFNPDLESKLLVRAEDAIIKAADNREVRVSIGRVFEKLVPGTK